MLATYGQSAVATNTGARRFMWNQHVGRIQRNLWLREEQRCAGVPAADVTPAEAWTPVSFITYANQYKNRTHPDSPVGDDGSRGLTWSPEVSADVFECVSVDAARAFQAFSKAASK